ncbi:MAG: hypothetical protein OEM39_02225, partial [Acidimicrobiia bacterium]|nr:hypothetical protein [Acidimicrobiia bacterium]
MINNHDLGALDEFYPHDYIYHNEDGSVERGRGSAVMVATRLIESAPDGVATVHDRSPRATAWPPDGAASARNTGSPVFGREADGAEMRAWGLVLSGSRTVGWPKIGNWF